MKENTEGPKLDKVVLKIQSFSKDQNAGEDTIEFTDKGLDTLLEIDQDPKKAVMMALQIAVKMKRFDADSAGSFILQSQNVKGKFEVPDWK